MLQREASVPFTLLKTHATEWTPNGLQPTLNVRVDARLVPSPESPDGMRLDYAHVVVLDNFFGEPERTALLEHLTAPGWDHSQGPPPDKWERETADGAGAAKTWGLHDDVLAELADAPIPAMLEIHSRLARLYPEVDIAHMPAEHMQAPAYSFAAEYARCMRRHSAAEQAGLEGDITTPRVNCAGDPLPEEAAFCAQFVGNAPVAGDTYTWHVDADPSTLPDSRWTELFGDYVNGEPGRPLLVSLLLYLDDAWPRDWAAETLFLDSQTDVGLVVRPKRYRAVLMDQDVLHRVSAPSAAAGGRPRYSLVWKLAFLPKAGDQACCLARPEWGPPTAIGSAAKVEAVRRSVGRKRKSQSPHQ
ncbi:hypothetical protein COCOBI_17-3340 [Coccomyxa sp. Obi]|nr:hypothetical protein COCOBI_17-3340 [Coccomyxa sp. Obi]